VAEIEAMGIEFNPMEHEALGTVETTEHAPGYVAEVVRAGYRLHDRVIQPAQVMVAKGPAQLDSTK
jgi:molecular chaperone GrpE